MAIDSSGNVYAAGCQGRSDKYDYGNGASATGTSVSDNVLLVKYDSEGNAQWARSVTAAAYSEFLAVTVDASGNIYAAGCLEYNGISDYGNGVIAPVTSVTGNVVVVLVKYDSEGNAQWAKSVTAGAKSSSFSGVAVDASGNVYAAGCQYGSDSYGYGNGVSVAGSASNQYSNAVLVKYHK